MKIGTYENLEFHAKLGNNKVAGIRISWYRPQINLQMEGFR